MLKSLWLLILLTQSAILASQSKQDYNWQLGTISSPANHSSPQSLEFTFNNGERMIRTFYRPMYMGHLSASISDTNGNLLLYSNGCHINNGKHETIPGSDNLSPGDIEKEWCDQAPGNYPITEGGLFLPFYGDSLVVFLHQRVTVSSPPLIIYVDVLFYTLLQKTGDSYEIVEKSIPVLEDSLTYGRLEAIRGEKEDYWWVIQGMRNSNKYYTMGWESGKLDTAFFQMLGDSSVRKGEAAAQSAFSPDSKKYARYSPADGIFLFDFDLSTGELSNYRRLHVSDNGTIGGLAFSPNSKYLYASIVQELYQFDVSMPDVQSTRTLIAEYDGFVSSFPATFYYMQLGPDCKIYMIPPNGIDVMHVIHNPDNKGAACAFEQHGIILPASNTITIPNFPVFRVFPEAPCDPNISTFILETGDITSDFKIYPNPAQNVIHIDLDDYSTIGPIQVNVIDMSGHIHIDQESEYSKSLPLDISMLTEGVYIIKIQDNLVSRYGKIVKMD